MEIRIQGLVTITRGEHWTAAQARAMVGPNRRTERMDHCRHAPDIRQYAKVMGITLPH